MNALEIKKSDYPNITDPDMLKLITKLDHPDAGFFEKMGKELVEAIVETISVLRGPGAPVTFGEVISVLQSPNPLKTLQDGYASPSERHTEILSTDLLDSEKAKSGILQAIRHQYTHPALLFSIDDARSALGLPVFDITLHEGKHEKALKDLFLDLGMISEKIAEAFGIFLSWYPILTNEAAEDIYRAAERFCSMRRATGIKVSSNFAKSKGFQLIYGAQSQINFWISEERVESLLEDGTQDQ